MFLWCYTTFAAMQKHCDNQKTELESLIKQLQQKVEEDNFYFEQNLLKLQEKVQQHDEILEDFISKR